MTTTSNHETPAQRRRRVKKAGAHLARTEREINPPVKAEKPNLFTTKYALDILAGLQHRHVYGGTVPDAVKAARRAKNRVARKARRP